MSNSFDFDLLKEFYDDITTCNYCGKYGADAFHHIFSRSGEYTGSILNACPLHNYTCHINIHGELLKRENQEKLFLENLKYLDKKGYKLKEIDFNFLIKYDLLDLVKEYLENR